MREQAANIAFWQDEERQLAPALVIVTKLVTLGRFVIPLPNNNVNAVSAGN